MSHKKDKAKDGKKGKGKTADKATAGKRRAGAARTSGKPLCKWDKAAYADRDTIGPVVRDAAFVCRKCGRAASDPAWLCKPLKLVRQTRAAWARDAAAAPDAEADTPASGRRH